MKFECGWFSWEWINWKKWHTFVNKKLDNLVTNAGSTFCNVSAQIDTLSLRIATLEAQIKELKKEQ